MNELQIFNNSEFGEIRTISHNGEPLFCLTDVCKSLGLNNVSQVKTRLKEDGVITNEVIDNLGRKQNATFINESNLYKTIFQSKKENAEKFTDWVTGEILPSIRKHGVYAVDEVLKNPDMLIAALQNLKEEREKNKELTSAVQQMDKVISEMTPKVDYLDKILSSNDCLLTSQVAQDYGMSARRFNNMLYHTHIQRKVGNQWILYTEHQGKGYVQNRTHEFTKPNGTTGTNVTTVWTQKGRMFLYNVLKEIGVLPSMEVFNEAT